MKIVGVTPVKMNNVRTPGKNTKLLSDGTPLIHLIQKAMLNIPEIDDYYVYCSNEKIQDFLLEGTKYMKRDTMFDTAEADVIEMMYQFSLLVDADVYIQIHATTPFISSKSIQKGIEMIKKGYDSTFAVKKMQDFLWTNEKPLNYSLEKIPRTQDMQPFFIETTGMYIYTKDVIQKLHRRIGNNPYLLEVSEIESIDIDDPIDFEIADAIYSQIIVPHCENTQKANCTTGGQH